MLDGLEGRAIVTTSLVGTVLFVVVAVAATLAPDALASMAAVVDVVLFFVGVAAFLLAYATAVSRSRTDAMGIGGLFFLAGSAPRRVQVLLLGALGAQTVVALATASIRIYTPLAFGVLVPMFGLGLSGLWGARYGTFDPRGPEVSPSDN